MGNLHLFTQQQNSEMSSLDFFFFNKAFQSVVDSLQAHER